MVRYAVRVRGRRRDAEAVASREGLRVAVEPVRTVLRGRVADQAALLQILATLRAHGVELLEVSWLPDEEPTQRERSASPPSTGRQRRIDDLVHGRRRHDGRGIDWPMRWRGRRTPREQLVGTGPVTPMASAAGPGEAQPPLSRSRRWALISRRVRTDAGGEPPRQ
jgi:hypothetical protein